MYKLLTYKGTRFHYLLSKDWRKIIDHTFTNVSNFAGKSFKISDYRGRWLILDFWTKYCIGCIASFPKMDKLTRDFRGKATIMMVGITHKLGTPQSDEKITKNIFDSRVKRYGYSLSSAFDSVGAKFDIYGVPTILIINPEGVLVGKSAELDSNIIATFIKGEMPVYRRSYSIHETTPNLVKWNPDFPLLSHGNGGSDTSFLSRSVLARWNDTMPQYSVAGFNPNDPNGMPKTGYAEAFGLDLPELFRLAYTGYPIWDDENELYQKFSRKVILNVRDTSVFKVNNGKRSTMNAYAYSLSLKNGETDAMLMRKYLLEDLERQFCLKSEITNKEVDVYKLVVIDQNKLFRLKSKGGKTISRLNTDRPGFILKNYPLRKFLTIAHLKGGLNLKYDFDMGSVPPIINETNLDINIDFQFNADYLDWNASLEILRANGLDLVRGKEEMKCIVNLGLKISQFLYSKVISRFSRKMRCVSSSGST